jgi:hypothetical protein
MAKTNVRFATIFFCKRRKSASISNEDYGFSSLVLCAVLRHTLVLALKVAFFGEEWKMLENGKGGGLSWI